MALVLPLLIMLLVGTITAGIAYGQRNSMQNAAREASRYAATLPGPVGTAWLQTVRDVTRAAATGHLETTAPGQFICVAFVSGGSTTSLTDVGGVETTSSVPCFDDGRPGNEARVQVVTSRLATIDGALFRWDVTLRSEAAAGYERGE
jgi:Flp pilus assembly protein TadG